MLKKLLFTSLCTVALATSGFAADLKINAEVETYYKSQTDYRTPLDSADYFETYLGAAQYENEAASNYRSGANNRSSQTTRAHGTIDFVGVAGENDYEGTPWYNFIGFMRLKIDANDPDDKYGTDRIKDGKYSDTSELSDFWIRYSPVAMLGIKVGTQTVAATANVAGIGYKFVGDKDDDFVYYTSTVIDEKPGISIDVHPTKDIELGVALIQGMGDLSGIVSAGSSAQANATIAWFQGNFGMVEATVGYQSIAVGGTTDPSDDVLDDGAVNKWEHKYTHTLTNAVIKFNIGDFSPFIGYQAGSGKNTSDEDLTMSSQMIGLIANLGPGKLAFEYTKLSTPKYGETGSVGAVIEADSTLHLNYAIPMAEGATITAFYNAFTAKKDDDLRDAITAGLAAGGANAVAATGLGARITSSTSSVGVSFKMKYGN